MARAVFSLILFLCVSAYPATWYVRQGAFGASSGTTYADAWNGIKAIVWGGAGVNTGDTIYVCGTNIFTLTGPGQYVQQISKIGVSGITIRGDYPGDPVLHFGGQLDHWHTINWNGPDVNGVYWTTNLLYEARYEVDNGIITWLPVKTNTTWTGGSGASFYQPTNYVRTMTGNAPSNNIACNIGGWMWELNGQSNITFLNYTMWDQAILKSGSGYRGDLHGNGCPTHITFKGCKLLYRGGFFMWAGMDYWTWDSCELAYDDHLIYGLLNVATNGPAWGLVTNCLLHDTIYGIGGDEDLHPIGMQAGSNWRVVNNIITNSGGTAIDFYGGGYVMTNVTIAGNFIRDIHGRINSGGGIIVDSPMPNNATQAGFRIYNNVIENIGLDATYGRNGIGLNMQEPVFICNNTIVTCGNGITVNAGTKPVCATIANNIIVGATNACISLTGTGTTNTTLVDYNLFYTNVPVANLFSINPNFTHDTHSISTNLQFTCSSPFVPNDFSLFASLPVVDKGTNVGLPFSGSAPDIGAIEYTSPMTIQNVRVRLIP